MESSLLVQIQTGQIGLVKFLYSCQVPGYVTASCECSRGNETPRHMALLQEGTNLLFTSMVTWWRTGVLLVAGQHKQWSQGYYKMGNRFRKVRTICAGKMLAVH